jgi:hypothetical protein
MKRWLSRSTSRLGHCGKLMQRLNGSPSSRARPPFAGISSLRKQSARWKTIRNDGDLLPKANGIAANCASSYTVRGEEFTAFSSRSGATSSTFFAFAMVPKHCWSQGSCELLTRICFLVVLQDCAFSSQPWYGTSPPPTSAMPRPCVSASAGSPSASSAKNTISACAKASRSASASLRRTWICRPCGARSAWRSAAFHNAFWNWSSGLR